jgi:hypothetical protein
MKRNNLKEYKLKQQETNAKLVQRAIDYLKKIGADIGINSVSRTTYEIADASKNEKGLTPAAISKNKLYKNMILKAKAEINNIKPDNPQNMSFGDLQIKLFQERQKNEELKIKIKILEDQLSKISLINKTSNSYSLRDECLDVKEENKHLKALLKGVIDTLAKLDIVENVDGDIRISLYGNVLLNKETLKLLD